MSQPSSYMMFMIHGFYLINGHGELSRTKINEWRFTVAGGSTQALIWSREGYGATISKKKQQQQKNSADWVQSLCFKHTNGWLSWKKWFIIIIPRCGHAHCVVMYLSRKGACFCKVFPSKQGFIKSAVLEWKRPAVFRKWRKIKSLSPCGSCEIRELKCIFLFTFEQEGLSYRDRALWPKVFNIVSALNVLFLILAF